MRKSVDRGLLSLILILIVLTGCSEKSPPGKFTAHLDISENGHSIISGSIFVDGWKYRMDVTEDGERVSVIADREKENTWVLLPDKKSCTYMKMDDPENISSDPFLGLRFLKSRHGSEKAGVESVSGYKCEHYSISDSDRKLIDYWESSELRFPLRIIEHGTAETSTELSDIVEGEIDEGIFSVPGDYTIMMSRWKP